MSPATLPLQLKNHDQGSTTSPIIIDTLHQTRHPNRGCQPPSAKMRAQILNTLFLSLLTLVAATTTTTITFHVPPSNILPNPRGLPPQTHATLTSLHADASALLTPAGTFVFRNVPEGSYLLDVHCPHVAFAPLRVDVVPVVPGAGQAGAEADRAALLRVSAWETYRGNDWGNTGEAVAVSNGGVLDVKVLGGKNFYVERSKCEYCLVPEGEECVSAWKFKC